MARDIDTAWLVVGAVAGRIMATSLGDVLTDRDELRKALDQAVDDVADLLDPDEVFDVEVDGPPDCHCGIPIDEHPR